MPIHPTVDGMARSRPEVEVRCETLRTSVRKSCARSDAGHGRPIATSHGASKPPAPASTYMPKNTLARTLAPLERVREMRPNASVATKKNKQTCAEPADQAMTAVLPTNAPAPIPPSATKKTAMRTGRLRINSSIPDFQSAAMVGPFNQRSGCGRLFRLGSVCNPGVPRNAPNSVLQSSHSTELSTRTGRSLPSTITSLCLTARDCGISCSRPQRLASHLCKDSCARSYRR